MKYIIDNHFSFTPLRVCVSAVKPTSKRTDNLTFIRNVHKAFFLLSPL